MLRGVSASYRSMAEGQRCGGSGVQYSDSGTRLCQTLVSVRWVHKTGQSFLPYTVGPCWLPVLNMSVCTGRAQTTPLDASEVPIPWVFPAPPTALRSLTHMVPTACQAPWGTLPKTTQRGHCSLEAGILGGQKAGSQQSSTDHDARCEGAEGGGLGDLPMPCVTPLCDDQKEAEGPGKERGRPDGSPSPRGPGGRSDGGGKRGRLRGVLGRSGTTR